MADAVFLVVDVPAEGTVLGQLTQQVAGLAIDLVGRPDTSTGTHCYVLDYLIGPIAAEAREAAADRLRPLYDDFQSEALGPDWHVRGRVPLANIQVPALRMIAGLYGLTHAPWLTMRAGRARAVMRPRDESSAEMLAALVRARLTQLTIDGQVTLETLPLAPYEERLARLAATIEAVSSS